jgi:hypothetical protein
MQWMRRPTRTNPWLARPVWSRVSVDPTLRTAAELAASAVTHAA